MNKESKDCCEKHYECPDCGKVCKTHRGLEIHIKACRSRQEKLSEEPVEEIIQITPAFIQTTENTEAREVVKDNILGPVELQNKEIVDFFDALGGRMTANRLEIEKIFNWYRFIYPQSSMNLTYGCPQCVQHAFKRVKEYYNKIK